MNPENDKAVEAAKAALVSYLHTEGVPSLYWRYVHLEEFQPSPDGCAVTLSYIRERKPHSDDPMRVPNFERVRKKFNTRKNVVWTAETVDERSPIDPLAEELKREAARPPRSRFFLVRPSGERLRLVLDVTSIGSDGCDYFLSVSPPDESATRSAP